MTQKNINIGTSSDKGGQTRRAAFLRLNANATDAELRLTELNNNKLDKISLDSQTVASSVIFLDDVTVSGELFTQGNTVIISDTIGIGGSNELLILENILNGHQSYFATNTITDGVSNGAMIVDAFDPFEKTDPQGQQQPDDSETFSSTLFVDIDTGEDKYYLGEIISSLSDLITYEWFIRSLTGITNCYIKAWIGEVTDPNTEKPNWKTNTTKEIINKENLVTNVGGAGIDIPFLLGKSYFQKAGDTLSFIIIADNPFTLQGATFAATAPFSTEIPYILARGTNWKLTELVKQGTDFLDFNPQSPQAPYNEARLYYNKDRETLDFYNAVADLTVNLPEESILPVWNATGSTITNGQVVKLSGVVTAGIPNIKLALADTVDNANATGVATHDIEDGTKGYITIVGSVGGLNTDNFVPGEILFLSNLISGGLENIEQQILSPIALCLVSDITEGIILVKPRGVVNITAIAQTRGQAHNQDVTNIPVICYCFDLNEFELNVDVEQALNPGTGDGYNAELSPSSIGASGFFRFTLSVSLSSNDNERFTLELYINASPTGLVANIDLNNPSTEYGTATMSGVTESIITPSDTLEIYIYHNGGAGTDTVTYDSTLFGIERIGNA